MKRALVKDLEIRKKLIDIIGNKPGIHFREILREADIAVGELEYHLGVLEKMELVSKTKTSYFTRYYPAYELGIPEKRIMGLLRQERLRDILLFIISSENPSHGDIAREFKLLKSTASFYLDKLRRHGIIEKEKKGRKVYFRVKDPERILRLILLYRKGFGDEIVERVEGLWGNL
ncbi:MAG: ArsR family transcriptional regulator [Thermoplasmata archaeon]|nr:MAG: ArsR family transcriptional regulator [Thermoplasmata archaeon]